MHDLKELRQHLQACRVMTNLGCAELTQYRDDAKVDGAHHPLLFQIVPQPRVMIIGSVPGGLGTNAAKAAYQKQVNGQYSIGHKSAQGIGEIMLRAAQRKKIEISPLVVQNPLTPEIQAAHLQARERLGLHVTNVVKCYAPTSWEQQAGSQWGTAATECATRFLSKEFELVDPEAVVLLGSEVATWFSQREGWGRDRVRITDWANLADRRQCIEKIRFVTAWAHPGGRYFFVNGPRLWPLYAEQLVQFIS